MIKMRIEFLDEFELNTMLSLIKLKYNIIDVGEVRESKRKNNKFKLVYIEAILLNDKG